MTGTVIFTAWSDTDGYIVEIQHPGNLVSIYKNCENLMVKTGDIVNSGSVLAAVGNNSSPDKGYHLHLELWYKGEAIDPSKYLTF